MKLAPIVLFVYNRPIHTKKTIEALKKNDLAEESELFIFSDISDNKNDQKDIKAVRDYIEHIDGFKKVTLIKRETNWGLANSIIDGVTSIIKKYEKVIVLEDDLITSPYFIRYMNEGLNFYQNEQKVLSITGFSFKSDFIDFPKNYFYDIYINIRPMSWSFATWKERWLKVDWDVKDYEELINNKEMIQEFNKGGTDLIYMLQDQMKGKVNSWYIRWAYHSSKYSLYTIYPKISFVNNLGHDETGVHCLNDPKNIFSHNELSDKPKTVFTSDITLNHKIIKNFNKAFNISMKSLIKKFLKKELV